SPTLPQVGWFTLFPLPSRLCTSNPNAAWAFEAVAMIAPVTASAAALAIAIDLRPRMRRPRGWAGLVPGTVGLLCILPPPGGFTRTGLAEPTGSPPTARLRG